MTLSALYQVVTSVPLVPSLGNCLLFIRPCPFSLPPRRSSFLRPLFSLFFLVLYEEHCIWNLICVFWKNLPASHSLGKCHMGLFLPSFLYLLLFPYPSLILLSLLVAKEYWDATFCTLLPSYALVGFLSCEAERIMMPTIDNNVYLTQDLA